MKRLLFLSLLLLAIATAFAQTYDAVMPGQKKVTTIDSTGNTTTQIVTDNDSEHIQYRSGSWYYKGQTMSKEEFLGKMKSECPAAYQQFQAGVHQKRTGIALAAVGGSVFLAGVCVWAWGASMAPTDYAGRFIWNVPMYAGLGVWVAGLAIGFGGGVPCIMMGNHKQTSANQVYNIHCAGKATELTFQTGITHDGGLGVIMQF